MADADIVTGWVAVVGGQECPDIAETLAGANIGVANFEDVDRLFSREEAEGELCSVVLWVASPATTTLSDVERLLRELAPMPLIVVSSRIERWWVRAALLAGTSGVLESSRVSAAMLPSLQAVLAGQTCVPRQYSQQVAPPALSAREKQILGLVVMGYMNVQIAEQLFLAESTVKSHLSSAFRKLGVRSRNEAVDLILDPDRGLGMGILSLGSEPLESAPSVPA